MIAPLDSIQNTACRVNGCDPKNQMTESSNRQESFQVVDHVRISDEARGRLNAATEKVKTIAGGKELTVEEQNQAEKLKKIEQEVKAHERAHMAAGSGLVMGGASYVYQRGPDGKMYAVGGEVKIDTSRENDPEATIRKMQNVRRAALAPAQPSATDRSVAAQASQIEAQARIERSKEKAEAAREDKDPHENPLASAPADVTHSATPFPAIGNLVDIVA
jgi:hypothetical protein